MEWQQFKYFQTLARTQHMTRAAEELLITQPALSRSIARFEEEVGAPLFDRQGRSIILNQYGKVFLKRVDNIMKEFDKGQEEIQALLDPEKGQVSLGFLHTLSTDLIPDLIASFRSLYPKVNFQLRQSPSHVLLEQLELGELDLCLIAPMEEKSFIKWQHLWSEELFVIVPKNHRYADRECIALEEIAEESFIHLKEGFSLRLTFEQLFEESGRMPHIMFEGEEADTVAGLVGAGLGISILPDLHGIDQSKIVKIPLAKANCHRVIGLAWIEGRYLSPAVKQFRNFVLHKFNDQK
ncbi:MULTISPECIES: LysR family transcriptional regulator [Priestia]|uniref:HTH-type transcriptional regulator GltC n=1 Tax=Priestia megaterium Q3 TaxID=1452722 RepID=A0A806TJ86_PRIMG|nr:MULTISPECIES: LysR family transcriptional regulator [Priestia]MCL6708891.1 LysR family transcriptional regulator [Pseudomonas sp. R2.Fl]AKP78410.1 HTH-type transcriptional regulator GltC [Priestia megaterium Q3]KML31053.1 LysR family transcriptional regulator [Priestia aryabhattai]KMN99523.1 LysR family transcriptional regulator [Priestia aryabhattai]KZE14363.1 LysR family transcriptional regulator [Priestia aryabhattai]